MNYGRDLTIPFDTIEHLGIAYTFPKDFSDHISRYRNLRQVCHNLDGTNRFLTLETVNPFTTNTEVKYHEVTINEVNRLDIIAYDELGSATYAWVIAYFNNIEDGYTVMEGQRLIIPNSITALMESGEVLAPIAYTKWNLGEE